MWRACAVQMLDSWWRWKWGGIGYSVPTQTSLSCLLTRPHNRSNPHYSMTQWEWVLLMVWIESCSPFVLLLQGVKCSHRSTHVRGYPSIQDPQTKAVQTDISTIWKWLKPSQNNFFIYKSLFMLLWNNDQNSNLIHIAHSLWNELSYKYSFSMFLPRSVNGVLESC